MQNCLILVGNAQEYESQSQIRKVHIEVKETMVMNYFATTIFHKIYEIYRTNSYVRINTK